MPRYSFVLFLFFCFFFVFFLLSILWTSWICCVGEFSVLNITHELQQFEIIILSVLSVPFSLSYPSGIPIMHVLHPFSYAVILGYSCLFLFRLCSLSFLILEILLRYPQVQRFFFSSTVSSLLISFISITVLFISSISFFFTLFLIDRCFTVLYCFLPNISMNQP